MIVALTGRHFRDLTELTGTTEAVAALADALDVDFTDEGERYRHRDALTGLFSEWFADARRRADHRRRCRRRRSCGSATAPSPKRPTTEGHRQPVVRAAATSPASASTWRPACRCRSTAPIPAGAAPALGDDTAAVLAEWLGTSAAELGRLLETGTVATGSGDGSMSALLGLLELRHGADDTLVAPGSGPAGKRAFGGQFVAQSRGRGASAPSTSRRCRPTCTCSSCAVVRAATPSTTTVERGVRRPDRGRPARAVTAGRPVITAATVSFAAPTARTRARPLGDLPGDPDRLAATGPAGPAPSMPLDEIDIRIADDRRGGGVRAAIVVAHNGCPARRSGGAHAGRGVRHRRVHDRSRTAGARAFDEAPAPIAAAPPIRRSGFTGRSAPTDWNLLESRSPGGGARAGRGHREPGPRRRADRATLVQEGLIAARE